MITQKPLLAILPLLLLSISNFGQSASRTLVKSFNLQGMNQIVLELDGDVEIKEWNNPSMRIQMLIELEDGSNSVLHSLITSHRYDLKSRIENNEFQIFAPGLQKQVIMGGKELKEKIRFVINIPQNTLLRQNAAEAEIVEGNVKDASLK
ncbi:MAG TPA: hypothetical protein PKC40_08495 [Saprospiraceae bacterium]|nr:hypothetical protein [Saprospiraceae bacterium]